VSTLQRTCVGITRTSFTAGGCSFCSRLPGAAVPRPPRALWPVDTGLGELTVADGSAVSRKTPTGMQLRRHFVSGRACYRRMRLLVKASRSRL
jgi:hypothetical protein